MQNSRWLYPFSVIQGAQKQKQIQEALLKKSFQLKIGAKVMLIANTNIQDCLVNGQIGEVAHIDIGQNTIREV